MDEKLEAKPEVTLRLDCELSENRLTLRDQFAMAVLPELVNKAAADHLAELCYAIADAMLAEREKGGEA